MKDPFLFLVMGICIGFGAGMAAGVSDIRQLRADAIKAGVAEYYIDANNERSFRWKGQSK